MGLAIDFELAGITTSIRITNLKLLLVINPSSLYCYLIAQEVCRDSIVYPGYVAQLQEHFDYHKWKMKQNKF